MCQAETIRQLQDTMIQINELYSDSNKTHALDSVDNELRVGFEDGDGGEICRCVYCSFFLF